MTSTRLLATQSLSLMVSYYSFSRTQKLLQEGIAGSIRTEGLLDLPVAALKADCLTLKSTLTYQQVDQKQNPSMHKSSPMTSRRAITMEISNHQREHMVSSSHTTNSSRYSSSSIKSNGINIIRTRPNTVSSNNPHMIRPIMQLSSSLHQLIKFRQQQQLTQKFPDLHQSSRLLECLLWIPQQVPKLVMITINTIKDTTNSTMQPNKLPRQTQQLPPTTNSTTPNMDSTLLSSLLMAESPNKNQSLISE